MTPGLHATARSPLTVRDILTPIFFFKRRVILALLIPLIAAFIAAGLARPIYVAEARLLILLGDDYVMRSPLGGAMPGLSFDRSQIVHAETEIIASREIAVQTLQAVGIQRVYPGLHGDGAMAIAAAQFQMDLTTENVPQSNVIKITLRNGNRDVSAEALNKLIGFYMVRRRQVFDQSNTGSIDKQSVKVVAELGNVEAQLALFSSQHGFGDYAQELTGIQAQRMALLGQIDSLEQQLATKNGRASMLAGRKAATPDEVPLQTELNRSQQIAALTENLLSLQNQRREAAAEYVDGSPIVAELDSRIAKVQSDIAAAPQQNVNVVRRGVNPVHQQIDTDKNTSDADAAGARQGRAEALKSLAQVNARLAELAALGPPYRELLRTRTLLEAELTELTKQSQTTKLANSLSRSQANVRVIQAAQPPIKSHTGRMVLLVAGVVVGVIAAAGVTVISVAIFQGMISPNEVEQKLAVPVVLTIPFIDDPQVPPDRRGLPAPAYLTRDDIKILMHLMRTLSSGANCSLQLIGATDGVGVTSLIVDIALLTAREGRKVLLLDFEPRADSAAADLLQRRGAVLTPLHEGSGVAQVNSSNLHVTLPLGHMELGETDWSNLLKQARREYHLVLIDAPPLARSWMGIFAAPSVDATLAIIAAEETRAPVALNLVERIGGAGGEFIGAILNKRRFYIPRMVYNWF